MEEAVKAARDLTASIDYGVHDMTSKITLLGLNEDVGGVESCYNISGG
jgi:hypothetical protein